MTKNSSHKSGVPDDDMSLFTNFYCTAVSILGIFGIAYFVNVFVLGDEHPPKEFSPLAGSDVNVLDEDDGTFHKLARAMLEEHFPDYVYIMNDADVRME